MSKLSVALPLLVNTLGNVTVPACVALATKMGVPAVEFDETLADEVTVCTKVLVFVTAIGFTPSLYAKVAVLATGPEGRPEAMFTWNVRVPDWPAATELMMPVTLV